MKVKTKKTVKRLHPLYPNGPNPFALAGTAFAFNGKIWVYTLAKYNRAYGEVWRIEAQPVSVSQ